MVSPFRQRFIEVARVQFSRLLAPFQDKLHGVVTLLAGLELAKRRQLALRQREPFAELWFYRRMDEAAVAVDADHRSAAVRE